MGKKLASAFNCPTEFTLQVLGGKWKTIILCYLKYQPLSYGDLRRLVPDLSDKMLSERLHDLLDAGLIVKHKSDARAARATYSLSAKGRALGSLLQELYSWGKKHAAAFGVRVDEPLKRLGYRD